MTRWPTGRGGWSPDSLAAIADCITRVLLRAGVRAVHILFTVWLLMMMIHENRRMMIWSALATSQRVFTDSVIELPARRHQSRNISWAGPQITCQTLVIHVTFLMKQLESSGHVACGLSRVTCLQSAQ